MAKEGVESNETVRVMHMMDNVGLTRQEKSNIMTKMAQLEKGNKEEERKFHKDLVKIAREQISVIMNLHDIGGLNTSH